MNNSHKPRRGRHRVLIAIAYCALCATSALAQDNVDLAKKLANPVASLISVPLQFNYDSDIGLSDGHRYTLNIQPVIPFQLNDDWNFISRTIVPAITQENVFPGAGSQSGLGDIVQSLFFSPVSPTDSGWIWGVGSVIYIPTATDDFLGADKWGLGPTAVALHQDGPWTYGILANHVWSVAGSDKRPDFSATLLQPFLSFTTPSAVTFSLATESTYDWDGNQWTVPIGLSVSKVRKFGDQLVSLGGGLRYWAEGPDSAPEGVSVRLTITLLYPR